MPRIESGGSDEELLEIELVVLSMLEYNFEML